MRRKAAAAGTMAGASIAFVLMACGGSSRPDAGTGGGDGGAAFDAGVDAGCAERFEAARSATLSDVCSDPGAGPAPAVTFRLRNASNADLWVATARWSGFLCQPTTFLSTCSGSGLGADIIQSELCLSPLSHLEPDASVDLEPYSLIAHLELNGCRAQVIGLPAGAYRVQFSYSLDAGEILQRTQPLAFSTPTDGGVVELLLP